jgi:hypothetical protein
LHIAFSFLWLVNHYNLIVPARSYCIIKCHTQSLAVSGVIISFTQ